MNSFRSETFNITDAPVWDIAKGLGLEWAKGKVPLSAGGHIEAEWKVLANGAKPTMSAKVVGNRNVKIKREGGITR
jgi:hypothetical protein